MKNKLIALSLLAVFCLFGLCACTDFLYYPNSEAYAIGSCDNVGEIQNLSVDWSAGKVNVVFADVDTVSVKEESATALTDDMQMRWLVEDGTLKIHFSAVGLLTAARCSNLHKTLTITLPNALVLSAFDVSLASSDLHTDPFSAKSVRVSSASGNLDVSVISADDVRLLSSSGTIQANVVSTPSLEISTSSGTVHAEIGSADRLTLSSSSGTVNATVDSSDMLCASTSSGRFSLVAENVGIFQGSSSSGDVQATVGTGLSSADISTSSGSVLLYLPKSLGFTLEESTGSGRFDCDFPLVTKDGTHVCGDGAAKLDISTSSGHIGVYQK